MSWNLGKLSTISKFVLQICLLEIKKLYQECTHMKFSGLIIHTLGYQENWATTMGLSLSKRANFPMSHSHWLYPECSQIYHKNVPLSQRESREGNCRSSYAYPNNNGSVMFPQKKWCSAMGEALETTQTWTWRLAWPSTSHMTLGNMLNFRAIDNSADKWVKCF